MNTELRSELAPTLIANFKEDVELWGEAEAAGVNQAGLLLNIRAARAGEGRFAEKDYWNAFLKELHEFLCTGSAKYSSEREKLGDVKDVTSNVIVPMIAGAIGTTLGIAQAVLTPFVALALFAIVKLTVNSWCAVNAEDLGSSLEGVRIHEEQSAE